MSATAQTEEAAATDVPTQEQIDAYYAELVSQLTPERGEIKLRGAPVTLTVPDGFDYYDKADTKIIAEDIWGNPPATDRLGMIFEAGANPSDADAWGVIMFYEQTGYVSDEDALDTDYDELLRELQAATRASNASRQAAGYEAVKLVGWAADPSYDPDTHRMYWAKEVQFGSLEENTLNYDMRVLGRRGVLSMTFVAAMTDLPRIEEAAPGVLSIPSFNEGNRYSDFQKGDAVAGYGVAGLVAGGAGLAVAKKTGILAVLLLALKKFGVFILVGLGALFSFARRLFSK